MEPMLPMPSQSESSPRISTPESVPPLEGAEQQGVASPVQEKVGEHQPVAQPQTQQVQAVTQQPIAVHPSTGTGTADQPTTNIPAPLVADDVDVIEKEWVDKAKKIVSSTKDDPHHQEKQVSVLQADYMMKRYNKKIKLAE